ncbi:MAG: type II toxin-antitoxin system VapC family toxin [Steroidobacteraceae bacterium]
MYLIDTDVISEARKGEKANTGVSTFFRDAARDGTALYLSVVTIGELRQAAEAIRHRGDALQAARLERWLDRLTSDFGEAILPFDQEAAHVWGRLRAPNAENPLHKQIAATALLHDLIVVTRNVSHYASTGVRVLNPFG